MDEFICLIYPSNSAGIYSKLFQIFINVTWKYLRALNFYGISQRCRSSRWIEILGGYRRQTGFAFSNPWVQKPL